MNAEEDSTGLCFKLATVWKIKHNGHQPWREGFAVGDAGVGRIEINLSAGSGRDPHVWGWRELVETVDFPCGSVEFRLQEDNNDLPYNLSNAHETQPLNLVDYEFYVDDHSVDDGTSQT